MRNDMIQYKSDSIYNEINSQLGTLIRYYSTFAGYNMIKARFLSRGPLYATHHKYISQSKQNHNYNF